MFLVVTPVYSRTERYCGPLMELVDKTWPGHPDIWFVTDGNGVKNFNCIKVKSTCWVESLRDGLLELRKRFPDLQYVYLVLEDFYPLWAFDTMELSKVQKAVVKHQLKHVTLPTYEYLESTEKRRFDDVELYPVPSSFTFYSQLQPAIWNFNHLLSTCEEALNNKIHNAWAFERIVGQETHYVSLCRWPSVLNGFMEQRRINRKAFSRISFPEGRALKTMLVRDYLLDLPAYIIYRLRRKAGSIAAKWRGERGPGEGGTQ